jgi:hypothetical protein
MAAKTLTLGAVATDTLPATAGQARQVICPRGARWLLARARSGELAVSDTGTDGVAPAATITVQRDQRLVSIRIPGSDSGQRVLHGPASVYLVSTVNSDVVELWAVAEDGS